MEKNNLMAEEEAKVLTWLFNPFHYIAGVWALIIGIGLILIAGFIGSFGNWHFDGILDTHRYPPAPFWSFFISGLMNWAIMGLLLTLAGMITSKSRFRVVDVFGTQALARFPMIISTSILYIPAFNKFMEQLLEHCFDTLDFILKNKGDFTLLLVVVILILLMIIWMVYLMYQAFSVSCNVKGIKAITIFIAALVIGEIISKVLFILIIHKNIILS